MRNYASNCSLVVQGAKKMAKISSKHRKCPILLVKGQLDLNVQKSQNDRKMGRTMLKVRPLKDLMEMTLSRIS